MSKFIDAIATNEALVGREAVRRYGGFYGPTCVVDFAFCPGSTTSVVNEILKGVDIPTAHKKGYFVGQVVGGNEHLLWDRGGRLCRFH